MLQLSGYIFSLACRRSPIIVEHCHIWISCLRRWRRLPGASPTGGRGGQVPAHLKTVGDDPPTFGYFSRFFEAYTIFEFSNIIKISLSKSEEKLNFEGQWVWLLMNPPPPIKTSWRRSCAYVTTTAHCCGKELLSPECHGKTGSGASRVEQFTQISCQVSWLGLEMRPWRRHKRTEHDSNIRYHSDNGHKCSQKNVPFWETKNLELYVYFVNMRRAQAIDEVDEIVKI